MAQEVLFLADRGHSGLGCCERLRGIRRQKRLSLQEVEINSSEEFKASVLGAYERGERAPRAVLGSLTLRTIEGLAPEALVDVDTPAEIEPWLRPDPCGQYPRDGDG